MLGGDTTESRDISEPLTHLIGTQLKGHKAACAISAQTVARADEVRSAWALALLHETTEREAVVSVLARTITAPGLNDAGH